MGRGDRRHSMKIKGKEGMRKKKAREKRKLKEAKEGKKQK